MIMTSKPRLRSAALMLAVSCGLGTGSARALDEQKDEKEKLKLCERRMCEMIVKKAPATGDLTCALTKTWASKTIKDGAEGSVATWEHGDARCTVAFKVPRAMIVEALSSQKVKLKLPRHEVVCEVERGKDTDPVRIEIAPKIEFKDGKASQIWVNVKKVEGPTAIKGLILTLAKVEDTVGLFQKSMLKAVNKFIQKKCPKVVAGE